MLWRRSQRPLATHKRDSKEDRWREFQISEVKKREFKLDSFKWLKDESIEDADELPEPEELPPMRSRSLKARLKS